MICQNYIFQEVNESLKQNQKTWDKMILNEQIPSKDDKIEIYFNARNFILAMACDHNGT